MGLTPYSRSRILSMFLCTLLA